MSGWPGNKQAAPYNNWGHRRGQKEEGRKGREQRKMHSSIKAKNVHYQRRKKSSNYPGINPISYHSNLPV